MDTEDSAGYSSLAPLHLHLEYVNSRFGIFFLWSDTGSNKGEQTGFSQVSVLCTSGQFGLRESTHSSALIRIVYIVYIYILYIYSNKSIYQSF